MGGVCVCPKGLQVAEMRASETWTDRLSEGRIGENSVTPAVVKLLWGPQWGASQESHTAHPPQTPLALQVFLTVHPISRPPVERQLSSSRWKVSDMGSRGTLRQSIEVD